MQKSGPDLRVDYAACREFGFIEAEQVHGFLQNELVIYRGRPDRLPIVGYRGSPIAGVKLGEDFPSERYDRGMTKSKIAISLPKDQLVKVQREVRDGRADSVSGYISKVLAEHEKGESLRGVLRDLIELYGEPTEEDIKWAEQALAPRRV